MTQAVVTKAATANSACWHHNAIVETVWSPVWARGEGIINRQLAGGVSLFTYLLALFQFFVLHVSVFCVMICIVCAAYTTYTFCTRFCVMSVMLAGPDTGGMNLGCRLCIAMHLCAKVTACFWDLL